MTIWLILVALFLKALALILMSMWVCQLHNRLKHLENTKKDENKPGGIAAEGEHGYPNS